MSDMDEDEDYHFDYSGEEPADEDDEEIEIQNVYYTSKGLIEETPEKASSGFRKVLDIQGSEKGDWGFKALKQLVKLNVQLGNREEMLSCYKEFLGYIKTAVTRNTSEKAINSILDFVTSHAQQSELLREFYEITLLALEEANNERLWFKTNLKLGKLMFQGGQYAKLAKILKELDKSCQQKDGTADNKKGTQLLEVYALEIQMHTATKNHKKLKELYEKSLQIKSAIPHPQIMGVIRECGGKMHMSEKEWSKAQSDFFESFKSYDEAGSSRRIACLKYLVLANILMLSQIDPFDSVEAKPYKNDPEIVAMTKLVIAYQQNDIKEFETILRSNKKTISEDPFIRDYIEDLLKSIRGQALKTILKPYTSIKIPFLANELGVSIPEIEALLVSLILDGQIQGRIDQVNSVLLLESKRNLGRVRFTAIDKLTSQLHTLNKTISGKVV